MYIDDLLVEQKEILKKPIHTKEDKHRLTRIEFEIEEFQSELWDFQQEGLRRIEF